MKYSDIALPEFQTEEFYTAGQEKLFPFYSQMLEGEVPEYFSGIGAVGGKEFEDVLGMTTRDITQSGLETGARMGMRGPRVGAGISRAVGDVSKQMRYADYERAIEGRKGLLTTGLTGMEGVRGAGLDLTNLMNQFALQKTQLGMDLAGKEEAKKKAESDRWSKVLQSIIGGVGTIGGMTAYGGMMKGATTKLGTAGRTSTPYTLERLTSQFS